MSQILEALHKVAAVHSFMLAVDPLDAQDDGFLGGTIAGREFWRGLRAGGVNGAQAFKAATVRYESRTTHIPVAGVTEDLQQEIPILHSMPSATMAGSGKRKGPASSLKSEVYSIIRNALRYFVIYSGRYHSYITIIVISIVGRRVAYALLR
jgi:hypothetical protein